MPYAEGQAGQGICHKKRGLQAFQLEHNSAAAPGPWEERYYINTCGILMKLAIPF